MRLSYTSITSHRDKRERKDVFNLSCLDLVTPVCSSINFPTISVDWNDDNDNDFFEDLPNGMIQGSSSTDHLSDVDEDDYCRYNRPSVMCRSKSRKRSLSSLTVESDTTSIVSPCPSDISRSDSRKRTASYSTNENNSTTVRVSPCHMDHSEFWGQFVSPECDHIHDCVQNSQPSNGTICQYKRNMSSPYPFEANNIIPKLKIRPKSDLRISMWKNEKCKASASFEKKALS
jgi:hypothetical protein